MEKLKVLHDLRIASNISLAELGKKIGRSKQYMWGLENGKIRLSYDNAVKLSAVFHETPNVFLSSESREMIQGKMDKGGNAEMNNLTTVKNVRVEV